MNMSREEVERYGLNGATKSNSAKILDSFYLYTDRTELSLGQWLSNTGYWESWITSWMTKIIKPGFRCIDIGANYGYYTRIMESLSGSNGYVYSVEANPKLCELLINSLSDYPMENGSKVKVINIAASDVLGLATLNVPTNLIGGATIVHQNYVGELIEVKSDLLDNYVTGHIDLIKMDIEGAEPMAWRGMQRILQNTDVIVLEISADTPKKFIEEINEKYNLSVINTLGDEVTISLEFFNDLKDLVMVVLRKK